MPTSSLKEKVALTIYAVSFGEATLAHLSDLLHAGWLPYHGPLLLRLFWTALIVLDPLVLALLLLRRRRTALLLAAIIMVADVGANTYAATSLHLHGFSLALPLQTLFLGFVLGSVSFLWPARR